jgi:hypothetical protein
VHHHVQPARVIALQEDRLAGREQTQAPSPDYLEDGGFVQPREKARLL